MAAMRQPGAILACRASSGCRERIPLVERIGEDAANAEGHEEEDAGIPFVAARSGVAPSVDAWMTSATVMKPRL